METTRCRPAGAALLALGLAVLAAPAAAQEDTGFEVNIVLSAKAAATLAARHEAMVIMVDYYGWPKKGSQKHADEMGQIGFGPSRDIPIPGIAGRYAVPAVRLDPQHLGWLEGPVQVNVNIASARKSSDDNLLDCDIIDGPLAEARQAPKTLACKLIGEATGTPAKP